MQLAVILALFASSGVLATGTQHLPVDAPPLHGGHRSLLRGGGPVEEAEFNGALFRRNNAGNSATLDNATTTTSAVHSRKRRYVVFPRGSSIQLVAEFTVPSFVPFTTIFTTTLTWGLAWRLPSMAEHIYLARRSAGEDPDLPHRAALLRDLSKLLDRLGLRGEHCVRRTLCDLHQHRPGAGNFVVELLKAVLTTPGAQAAVRTEPNNLDDTSAATPRREEQDCAALYPHCPSVLDLPINPEFDESHNADQ